MHLRFDDVSPPAKNDAYSARAFEKVTATPKRGLGKPALGDATTVCFDRVDLGPLLVARKQREWVMLAGPAKAGSDTWRASSTCKAVKPWALEIAAQR